MKIVVVGGVAAGASAAAKARRVNEQAEIIIFEQGEYVSFANCGLPYYVGGTIQDRDELLLVTPELFKSRYNIDVRVMHKVTSIDPETKTVKGVNALGDFEETYDKLVLAMGGEPIKPPMPGSDLPGVYNVFTVPDVDKIMEALGEGAKRAVVVGGGFIGVETADELACRGIDTTLVELAPQLLNNFDKEMTIPVERQLEENGVKIALGKSVTEIHGEGKVQQAVMSDGTTIDTDMVILAVGVRPRTQLAVDMGVEIGPARGIVVDAGMRTNIKDVYAAGDIVESTHLVSGKRVRIPLAGSANKQGRVAGVNAAGGTATFRGVMGTAILKVGEIAVGRTGLSEKEAIALDLPYATVLVPTNSNAGYYPTAETIILKLVYETPTGKILGCQAVGRKGVDKRIDVISTAIMGGLTVFDLENLDLAYAPPYGSAKDAIIMMGMVASNAIRGEEKIITNDKALALVKEQPEKYVLLDVRTEEEFVEGHMDGAVLFPVDDIRSRIGELDKSKSYFVSCAIGARAWLAHCILKQNGFDVANVTGGWLGYNMYV